MSANGTSSRPPAAALIGPHVVVEARAAAMWAPALAKALQAAQSHGQIVEPQVRDVLDAFRAAAAFVSESNAAKAADDPSSLGRGSLTVAQVAKLADVSKVTVRTEARHERLPGRRMGRAWLFEPEDVNTWIKQRRKDTADGA